MPKAKRKPKPIVSHIALVSVKGAVKKKNVRRPTSREAGSRVKIKAAAGSRRREERGVPVLRCTNVAMRQAATAVRALVTGDAQVGLIATERLALRALSH